MLYNNYYIKKLIDYSFKGIILEQLETSSDSMSFSFSLEIKTHNYPKCHQQTNKVHDSINSISLGRSLGHLKELSKRTRKGEDISKEVAPFS